jgi:hypothetical protein
VKAIYYIIRILFREVVISIIHLETRKIITVLSRNIMTGKGEELEFPRMAGGSPYSS